MLIGPPGSGKGTQARKLKEHYAIPHISSGDVLRSEVARGTELGGKIKTYMDRGEIGPVELITAAILGHVKENCPRGFLLDGFPRTLLGPRAGHIIRITADLFISVPESEIVAASPAAAPAGIAAPSTMCAPRRPVRPESAMHARAG